MIGMHLAGYYVYSLGYWEIYPHLIGTTVAIPLLHGPMLYLYTLYSLRNEKKIRRQEYWHFAPALFFFLYMVPFYFFYTAEQKILVDQGLVDDFANSSVLMLIGYIISGLIYPMVSYRLLGKYRKLVDDNFSYHHRISLGWLKYSIFGIGAVYITGTIIVILREGLGVHFPFNADYIFYTLIVLFVVCIGFFGIRRENVFSENSKELNTSLVTKKSTTDYEKSGLKTDLAEEIHVKLKLLMSEKELYANPKLTLSQLAGHLEISANNLSQIINQYEKVNFYDFVNAYRLEAFIKNAVSDKSYSLLGHAYDAGFNSKSSFNSVFKKHHGMTPSKYIAQMSGKS